MDEIVAEGDRFTALEANQRPVLPSLREEITQLQHEVHVQSSELRVTRSELHAASARSSEWEHAGNSVGFPSTRVSHTPVTSVSPSGSNSRNGSKMGTPDKGIDQPVPPAPQGLPVTYGPENTTEDLTRMSTFREFARDLFGGESKGVISWGGSTYTLEQSTPVSTSNYQGRAAAPSTSPAAQDQDHSRLDPPPGLGVLS